MNPTSMKDNLPNEKGEPGIEIKYLVASIDSLIVGINRISKNVCILLFKIKPICHFF